MGRPEPVEELPNPPPAGTVWFGIEAARKKLRWSARKLSVEAGFAKNPTRYSTIANRGNWEEIAVGTVDKFVDALVRAGIHENEIRTPLAKTYGIPETSPMLAKDSVRDKAAGLLIRRGYGVNTSLRYVNSLPLDEANKPDPERVASMAEDSIKSAVKNGVLGPDELAPATVVGTERVHVRRVKPPKHG